MNSPYVGTFKVSQKYKGTDHDGMDLVGITSKDIYSTINGTVLKAGWENPNNTKQGFGQYVKIQEANSPNIYYFGHLSAFSVKAGQVVAKGQKIGVEGNTGKSTGSHCHYCCRINGDKAKHLNIADLIGIPNAEVTYEVPQNNVKEEEEEEMRCYYYKDLPDWAKPTFDKLIAAGKFQGYGGTGENRIIDLGIDAVRTMVVQYSNYYYLLKEVPAMYRPTIDKLVAEGVIGGRGGFGEDRIIDLTEDAIRTIIFSERMREK